MKIQRLTDGLDCRLTGDGNTEITGLCYDSRQAKKGDLFFCISGLTSDGHGYARAAVENGAAALMVTRQLDLNVPQIIVEDDRLAMSLISAAFYGHPTRGMKMVGVTGTNGKTTTTYMIKSIAEQAGEKVGLIGTIVNMIGDTVLETERTTPESPDLQALLRRMADEGCTLAVMEVSSHSLDLRRVAGITYDAAVFSNLTQDHLDYHKTIENYRDAKKKLFCQTRGAASNADDPYGPYMLEGPEARKLTYGIRETADVFAREIEITPSGVCFEMHAPEGCVDIRLKIPGIFSVYNALCSASAAMLCGFGLKDIRAGLECLPGVNGRFEVLDTGNRGYTVILDYAHTPDSLENTLKTVKEFARGRIVTLFGCGGDRDKGKRPIMGEIAGRLSTFTVLTSDNPRTEIPAEIMAQIEDGLKAAGGEYICIENRREAIHYALAHARLDDIIILAGKGHETYQEINKIKYPFDEKVIVKELLETL